MYDYSRQFILDSAYSLNLLPLLILGTVSICGPGEWFLFGMGYYVIFQLTPSLYTLLNTHEHNTLLYNQIC